MAGLVANEFSGPWRWSHLDWELPFYRVWDEWSPSSRNSGMLPRFEIGGHRSTSQAREMLWQLKRTSPFHDYQSAPLTREPFGLSPIEYLEIWVKGASPEEWINLATAFLTEMDRK